MPKADAAFSATGVVMFRILPPKGEPVILKLMEWCEREGIEMLDIKNQYGPAFSSVLIKPEDALRVQVWLSDAGIPSVDWVESNGEWR